VLIAGGENESGLLPNAELYDPATDDWTRLDQPMITPRFAHTATLLRSGKVLVAGGFGAPSQPVSSAELYDPAPAPGNPNGTWTATGNSMTIARHSHTATLLSDVNGKVLVAGGQDSNGYLDSAELYDPSNPPNGNGTWAPTASLNVPRFRHTATLLSNGKVLVAGGSGDIGVLRSAELYDPMANPLVWMETGSMGTGREAHTATLLSNGKVLVASGNTGTGGALDPTAELYDPTANPPAWSSTGNLPIGRYYHTATLLSNGKVLVTGGYGSAPLSSAELYANGAWTEISPVSARYLHTATLLPNGKVLIAGGYNDVSALDSAQLYDPIRF
jgi:hypothetical protein